MAPKPVVAFLVAVAISLQGCSVTEFFGSLPPRGCLQMDIEDGSLRMTSVNEAVDTDKVCNDGFEWEGPKLECGWVNRECKAVPKTDSDDDKSNSRRLSDNDKTDKEDASEKAEVDNAEEEPKSDMGGRNPDCQETFGFVATGAGLKSWPDDQPTVAVDQFTHNWKDYLTAVAKDAASAAKGKASELKDKVAESDVVAQAKAKASDAMDAAKDAASAAKGKALELKAKVAESDVVAKAKAKVSDAVDAAKDAASAAKGKAAILASDAKSPATDAAEKGSRRLAELPVATTADELKGKCVKKPEVEEKAGDEGDSHGERKEEKFLRGSPVIAGGSMLLAAFIGVASVVAATGLIGYRTYRAGARSAELQSISEGDEALE